MHAEALHPTLVQVTMVSIAFGERIDKNERLALTSANRKASASP
jgi:hypothetical protein